MEEVVHETKTWRRAAQALKIARADIELTGGGFCRVGCLDVAALRCVGCRTEPGLEQG